MRIAATLTVTGVLGFIVLEALKILLAPAALWLLAVVMFAVKALLIGLGIDFVIVSYGRFVEERRAGSTLEQALARMSGSSGRAVIVGGVTSAATFYAFTVTDFTGLREMGLLTGTGILLCMAAVVILLPAMLAAGEDRHSRRRSFPRLYLHGFASGGLIRFCIAHPRPVLGAGLVLTLAAALLCGGLRFDDTIQAMRPAGNPGVAVRDEVGRHFGTSFDQMMLLIDAPELEEVLEITLESIEMLGPAAVAPIMEPSEDSFPALPAELARDASEQIREAADMGDISQLKSIAEELSSKVNAFSPVAKKIIQLAEEFDFEGLVTLADNLLE